MPQSCPLCYSQAEYSPTGTSKTAYYSEERKEKCSTKRDVSKCTTKYSWHHATGMKFKYEMTFLTFIGDQNSCLNQYINTAKNLYVVALRHYEFLSELGEKKLSYRKKTNFWYISRTRTHVKIWSVHIKQPPIFKNFTVKLQTWLFWWAYLLEKNKFQLCTFSGKY